MGTQLTLARRTELATRQRSTGLMSVRQLELGIDDARLRGMTPEQRREALMALAQLLLEANGTVTAEIGHDDA